MSSMFSNSDEHKAIFNVNTNYSWVGLHSNSSVPLKLKFYSKWGIEIILYFC